MGEGTFFSIKSFSWEEQTFLSEFIGVVLHGRTNDQIIPRVNESFSNAFSSNLNTVNSENFSNHGEIYT